MKVFAHLVVMLVLVLITSIASAADEGTRPAGVEPRNWIAITERLGFVVVNEKKSFPPFAPPGGLLMPPDSVSAEHRPPRKGYFVVKTEAGWERLTVVAPADIAG
jgi:hypothetical protein